MKRVVSALIALLLLAVPAWAAERFTPVSGAAVTAATLASLIAIPSTMLNEPRAAVVVTVASGANAALGFSSGAVAPSSTANANALPALGGTETTWQIPVGSTAVHYIRVGGSDATVYLTFGYTEK